MRRLEPQVPRVSEDVQRLRYSSIVASPLAGSMLSSDAHLFCVVSNGFPSKRETTRSVQVIVYILACETTKRHVTLKTSPPSKSACPSVLALLHLIAHPLAEFWRACKT